MTWQLLLLLYILILLIALASGIWIGFALALAGFIGLLAFSGTSLLKGFGWASWNTLNSFELVAVPLFFLMGELIDRSGIGDRAYMGINPWLSRLPGGLLHSNIVACALMACISGSSVATAATIGKVAIPALKKRGYNQRSVYGSLAAGGTLGILIPPSTIMIVYAAWTEQSVAKLFMAGFVPGWMLAGIFMIWIMVHATLKPNLAPREKAALVWKEALPGTLHLVPLGVTMVVVLGGIYTGIVTATEAAALGCLCALVITFIYGKLNRRNLGDSLGGTVRTCAWIFFIVTAAQILQFGLVNSGATKEAVRALVSLNLGTTVFMLAILTMYAILGCFLEGISMMLLTLPLVYPVIVALGFSPILFGILLVMEIELGLITPPIAMNLFVIQGISGAPLSEVIKGVWPFWGLMVSGILLVLFFPQIALWLPAHM